MPIANSSPNMLIISNSALAGNAATATFKGTVSNPSPPPLTERFRNQGQCVSDGNANPDEGITRQAYQEAFVEEEEIEEPGVE